MGISNATSHVWASNAGEQGRPSGVSPVWIENIDAITPSGSGGSTYTGGEGIDVDNDNDIISLDAEAQAAIDSYVNNSGSFLTDDDLNGYATETYVTNEIEQATSAFITSADLPDLDGYATETWVQNQGYITSIPSEYVTDTEMSEYVAEETSAFVTSADIPEVPGVKDLIAGNGINISATSGDVTIAAKVDGSTIKFDGSGNLSTDITGVPTTSGASSGDVLTFDGTSVGWAPSQGGGSDTPLPAIGTYTLRFKFADPTFVPVAGTNSSKGSWTAVDSSRGIWDWNYASSDWSNAFYSSSSLLPIIDTWVIDGDMDGVTNLYRCFHYAKNLKGFKVTKGQTDNSSNDTREMFLGCSALEYVDYAEEFFNAGNGSGTFYECTKLTSVPIINTAFSSSYMFYWCTRLRNVTVTGLQYSCNKMFSQCIDLEHVNVLYAFNSIVVSSINSCEEMFNGCSNLREIPLLSINPSVNYNCNQMFYGCGLIEYIPTWISRMNISSGSSMFRGCKNLRTIPFLRTADITNVSSMFSGCSSIESGAATLYQQMSQQANPPATTTGCFTNCGSDTLPGTAELAQIPSSWGGTGT